MFPIINIFRMDSYLNKAGVIADGLLALLLGNVLFSLAGSALIPSEWITTTPDPDTIWQAVAGQSNQIGLRLSLVLLLGILIWKLRTGLSLENAAFTTGERSLGKLIGIGFLTFCFASMPWKGIVWINQLFPFGEGLGGWDYLGETDFSAGLVVYILVSAMLLPPILEELFVRGIWLNRIKMEYGPIGAVLITGCLFPLFHGHFYQSDPVVLSQLAAFIFASCVLGWVTIRTNSVIPAIVAHALGNSPEPSEPLFMGLIISVMLLTAGFYRQSVLAEWKAFLQAWSEYHSTVMPALLALGVTIFLLIPVAFESSFLLVLLLLAVVVVTADALVNRMDKSHTTDD